jgi:hypothetical protein
MLAGLEGLGNFLDVQAPRRVVAARARLYEAFAEQASSAFGAEQGGGQGEGLEVIVVQRTHYRDFKNLPEIMEALQVRSHALPLSSSPLHQRRDSEDLTPDIPAGFLPQCLGPCGRTGLLVGG